MSNFFESTFTYCGKEYKSVEHAYQSMKAVCSEDAELIRLSNTPDDAKKMSRKIIIRTDWESMKFYFMNSIVREKFIQNNSLRKNLLDTYPQEIIEGNWWGDTYWGVCNGVGQNQLGKILMTVREELK